MSDMGRKRILERMREREEARERMMETMNEKYRTKKRWIDLTARMGFVSVNPLGITISGLLNSSRVSTDPRSQELLIFAEYGVKETVELFKSLNEFGGCVESKRMKALEEKIREAVWEVENVLDSHVSDQFLSQCQKDEGPPLLFSLNLHGIEQHVDVFMQRVMTMEQLLNPWFEESGLGKKPDISGQSRKTRSWFMGWFALKVASVFGGVKEDYIRYLDSLLPEEEDDDDYAVLFAGTFSSEDRFSKIKEMLMIRWINMAGLMFVKTEEQLGNPSPAAVAAAPVIVMGTGTGTGNAPLLDVSAVHMVGLTDLFCKIRDDLIEDSGGFRMGTIVGMAGIGKTTLAIKILQDPLICSEFECRIFVPVGPGYQFEDIKNAILAQMRGNDDKMKDLDRFLYETLGVMKCLIVLDDVWDRDSWNISRIFPWKSSESWILVTTRINEVGSNIEGKIYQVPFLDKKESWDLLRSKTFPEERCSYQFEKVGKKIAENCEGLPLLIVTVADLLSRVEKTLEYWSKVAANKTNSIFVEAYIRIYEVVYPNYSDLTRHLKACFLFLGVFPQNDEVRISKLIGLWSADGFLGLPYTLLQEYVYGLLEVIVSNNVALGTQWSHNYLKLKVCSLHSVFWYLCKNEAWNEKFLVVLNSYADASAEGLKGQRRLSIYKNVILSIKSVRNSISSMPHVRSLLCTGLYHQYQVPVFFGLRLLKVLDALSIRFYKFPMEVFKLLHLNYLALTCNENLPPSISRLWSLQSLIVHRHLSIKPSVSESYLPVEIWELQELEHLQIVGRNFPDPPRGAFLRNLLTLLDVGAHTCTKRVLGSLPALQKLRVQIELMPGRAEPLGFCDDVSSPLESLRSFQCVVVNPELMHVLIAPTALVSFNFLRKLTLSGSGYLWKEMREIAELSHLEVLKLKCYAFRGERWQVKEKEFRKLSYLLIEDTDLVEWTGVLDLDYLTMKNCYKLREIPKLSSVRVVRLVDCKSSAERCVKQMAPRNCRVYAEYSWLDNEKHS